MRTMQRLGAIGLAALVMTAVLALPASAQTVETRPESFIATAAARGLELNLFGNRVTVGQASAIINSTPMAKASGAGVAVLAPGTTSSSEVTGPNQSAAPPKACLLNVPIVSLLAVELACGESKVDTGAAGPSAFGKGSVAGVDVAALNALDPIIQLLQTLLAQLLPVVDQTVGTVINTLPGIGGLVGSLATTLGLGTTSTVAPVSSLVNNLLEGVRRATGLVDIALGESIAQTVTSAAAVTATANAAGARIDLLPGLTLGGTPLLSIIVGQAKSVSTFDRATAKSTPTFDAAVARVRLGALLGGIDIPISLGAPLTLLAGTPLETTISLGAGRTVTDPNTGAVASYADGVSIQLLKGLNGGIALELAHAETGVGGQTRLVSQQQVIQPVVPALAKTGNGPWLPLTGAGLLVMALGIRRRVLSAQAAGNNERVSE